MYPVGGFQTPDRSGLPSGSRGAGAERFGLPSAPRGMGAGGTFAHCAKTGEENKAMSVSCSKIFIPTSPHVVFFITRPASRRQPEGDKLSAVAPAADRDDDVLPAIEHVGHRR